MQPDNKQLIHKLFRLEMLLHRLGHAAKHSANPHRGQGRVLALVQKQPDISQKELAFLLDLRQQSLSELLAKLEQKGLIQRTPSGEDKRVSLIHLTEAGQAAVPNLEEQQGEDPFAKVFEGIPAQDLASFEATTDQLIAALEAQPGMQGSQSGHHGHHGHHGCQGGHGRGHGHHGGQGCGKGHGHHRPTQPEAPCEE